MKKQRKNHTNMNKIKTKCPLESTEAKKFWQWSRYHPIAKLYLYAVQNGGYRNPREAKNQKDSGTRAGVSDYNLPYPHNGKHGLWIELKRADKSVSRLTEEQAAWLAAMELLGHATCVAYGADEAIKAVEEYLR